MTIVGAGGIRFTSWDASPRFKKDYKKLDGTIVKLVKAKLEDVLKNPFPAGLGFEKLSGYSDPDVYTFHVTGNFKVSLETRKSGNECIAFLRRVGPHDLIDRSP